MHHAPSNETPSKKYGLVPSFFVNQTVSRLVAVAVEFEDNFFTDGVG